MIRKENEKMVSHIENMNIESSITKKRLKGVLYNKGK